MSEHINKNPIVFGIVTTIIIDVLFLLAHLFIPSGINNSSRLFIDSAMRIVFAVPCILLLGYCIQNNGFRFSFKTDGFAKGLFASSAIFLFMLTMILKFLCMTEMNTLFIPQIPAVIAQQITTGLFEESLFRGLLMTAMLIQWGSTAKGRVMIVLVSGIFFGAAHLTNFFFGGDLTGVLMNALGACLIGIGYAAVYLYSKNLLCCMFLHAAYDIAVHISNGLIAKVWGNLFYRILDMAQPIILFAIIPIFAILLSVKAKPFVIDFRQSNE